MSAVHVVVVGVPPVVAGIRIEVVDPVSRTRSLAVEFTVTETKRT